MAWLLSGRESSASAPRDICRSRLLTVHQRSHVFRRVARHRVLAILFCAHLAAGQPREEKRRSNEYYDKFYAHGYYEEPDADDAAAVGRLKERLTGYKANHTIGIVMYTDFTEKDWNHLTIPVWKAYSDKHGYDLFVQEEKLVNPKYKPVASKPLLLSMLYSAVKKWKYLMLVDSNMMPVGFKVSLEDFIKMHMKKKRWKNDKPGDRVIWCPLECEEGTVDELTDGTCYGAVAGGCIIRRKPMTKKALNMWHNRREDDKDEPRPLLKSLKTMRERNWDQVFFSNAGEDIGRQNSKFLATFQYEEGADGVGTNIRKMIDKAIKDNNLFGDIVNEAEKRGEL